MAEPLTLGEFRELTADLPDEVLVKWMVPDGPDDWRTVGFDVSVYMAGGPSVVVFEADESIRQHQALGICWCGRSHPIPEAIALNTQEETHP